MDTNNKQILQSWLEYLEKNSLLFFLSSVFIVRHYIDLDIDQFGVGEGPVLDLSKFSAFINSFDCRSIY